MDRSVPVNVLPAVPHEIGDGRKPPIWLDLDCGTPWVRRKLGAREHVFHQGDRQNSVYVVSSGFVRLYSLLSSGRNQIIGFKTPGDFVAFENGNMHRWNAQAVTPTELHSMSRSAFFATVAGKPQFLLHLYQAVCGDLSRSHDLILTISKRDAEASIAAFILEIDARSTARGQKGEFIALPMLRGDIANYLGLTNETVSRTFTHFKKIRMIEVRGRFGLRLIDRRALRAIAERIPNERNGGSNDNRWATDIASALV